jgi:hypothetical protein
MQKQAVSTSYAWSKQGIPTDRPHCQMCFFLLCLCRFIKNCGYVSWNRPPHFRSPNKLKLVMYRRKELTSSLCNFLNLLDISSVWSNYSAYIAVLKVPYTGFSFWPRENCFVYFKFMLLGRIKFLINFFARLILVLVCRFKYFNIPTLLKQF